MPLRPALRSTARPRGSVAQFQPHCRPPASEAVYLGNLGCCYADEGDHARAIELYGKALTIHRDVGDQPSEARNTGNLANRLSNIDLFGEAIKHYEHAIALDKEMKSRKDECHDTYNLAELYRKLGEAGKARALAEEARKLAWGIGYRLIETAAIALLAELMIDDGHLDEAIKQLEDARALADESNDMQFQSWTRQKLASALLQRRELARARTAVDEAKQYRYPSAYPSVLALAGVVAQRQGDTAAARDAFEVAVAEANERLGRQARAYNPAYAKALAIAGLALCRDADLTTDAAQAYREARAISAAPGIVTDALRDLDLLAAADPTGILRLVRDAAAGET